LGQNKSDRIVQGSLNRIDGTGQEERNNQDRKESQNDNSGRTAMTGEPGQDS
jgi:hypothetical protein